MEDQYIEIEFTSENMDTLGYPMYIRTEVYKAYYNWVKENKPITEFKFTYKWNLKDMEKFMADTAWIDR